MKDVLLTMFAAMIALFVCLVIGEYHHPDDEIKAMFATNRALIVTFYGVWFYTVVCKKDK